jgi:hypothetical protein
VHGALLGLLLGCLPSLTLSWSDGHGLVPEGDAVRSEVDAILWNAGLSTRWVEEVDRARLASVRVVVSPSEPSGPGWNLEPPALGVYLVSEESSAAFVFHDRVLAVLGLSRSGVRTPAERRMLARALARVAVHEIVHRIAPALPHAEAGIMRSRLDRALLTRERAFLDSSSVASLLELLVDGSASE